jgi:UDP-2-acetamido-2,6-beta-L-arabino-hexul-4-ose reductase
MNLLITGTSGFLGSNLLSILKHETKHNITILKRPYEKTFPTDQHFDICIHLGGVNRPPLPSDFTEGNVHSTAQLCNLLQRSSSPPIIVYASSVQALSDNDYGKSKLAAEAIIEEYSSLTGTAAYILRLPGIFGKWCLPNYNSVVATFCQNIANDVPVQIHDPNSPIKLMHVDDATRTIVNICDLTKHQSGLHYHQLEPVYETTVGELAAQLSIFKRLRSLNTVPNMSDEFVKKLYSTFISYLNTTSLNQSVELKSDNRGWLFEFTKSNQAGQIFISSTLPGITRGNHFHQSKVEKFCVIKGKGVIILRHLKTDHIVTFDVSDENIETVDIPPGYAHSIKNTGETEMLTLFWTNEIFDQKRPDTYPSIALPPS